MSDVVVEAAKRSTSKDAEILSDEQIEQLLQEAETRLRQKAGLRPKSTDTDKTLVLEPKEADSPRKRNLLRLQNKSHHSLYIKDVHGVAKADPTLLVTTEQKRMAAELRSVGSGEASGRVNDQMTSGPQWYDLPKTELTPALKRDLQLIEMRNVLDPHRHYKKNTRKGEIPTFSQTGTVVEGAAEWYSSRLNRKERAKNFVDEAMRNEQETGRFKRKYAEIQDAKTSGKKAHYKKLMEKRQKKR